MRISVAVLAVTVSLLRAGTARRVRVSVVATDGAGNSAVVRRAVRLPATMGRHDLR
jgi:hypothetical protein